MKEELIRYRPGLDPKPEDKTDWERVRNMTDEEVEAAALADPDAQPLTDEELARAFRPGGLVALRQRLGLEQAEFARRFQIDLDTLRESGAWAGRPRRYRSRLSAGHRPKSRCGCRRSGGLKVRFPGLRFRSAD